MAFRIDSTSHLVRDYIRKYTQSSLLNNTSSLQIKTADAYDDLISINADNFVAENATFQNGTVIAGQPNAPHGIFGSLGGDGDGEGEEGELSNRRFTSSSTFFLRKGTHICLSSVCGESSGGSIVLEEDPDGDEDVVIEISLDNIEFTRLFGRITERNSSTSSYIEYRFMMTEESDNYYIRIAQTKHSGSNYDYYAFKNLKINLNSSIYDSVNKILVF